MALLDDSVHDGLFGQFVLLDCAYRYFIHIAYSSLVTPVHYSPPMIISGDMITMNRMVVANKLITRVTTTSRLLIFESWSSGQTWQC